VSKTKPYLMERLTCGCYAESDDGEKWYIAAPCEKPSHRRFAKHRARYSYRLPILRWLLTGSTK
jgi:hypothetical protein